MRIRKRNQNPLRAPDPSPPAASEAGASRAAATGGEEGEAAAAAAAVAASRGCGDEEEGELHQPPYRHLHGQPPQCLPVASLPSDEPPSAAEGVRVDLPPLGEIEEGENGGDGGARRRRSSVGARSGGGGATALKSFGAESFEVPVGHGEHQISLAGVGEEFPLKKKRGGLLVRGTRPGGDGDQGVEEQEEEKALIENGGLIERESKATPYGTRRRSTIAAATDGTGDGGGGSGGGAPAITVKEEGGLLLSAAGPSGKKRRSPAVLMEGSRCSRVNGRGWRCFQQTLVGYSLCEHHLGKGRLRSMNSVRCNARGRKKEAAPPPSPTVQPEEKGVSPGKRRKKIGMVKARSISSLLHQPHLPTPPTTVLPVPSPSPGTISASLGYPINHDSVMA